MRFLILLLTMMGLAAAPTVTREGIAARDIARKAASGEPKAIYDLAVLHDLGYDSIPVDSARSTALYLKAAEAGYAPAQNYIGFRYFTGEAVRQDVDSALFWMGKAAGNGDAKAANNLGFLLANSDKVTRDYTQAVYWLSKAADAGLPAGMSQLADLLRQGRGCIADTARAEELYTKAIQGGLHDAELKLLAMKGYQWEKLPADSALSLGKYHYTHGAPSIGVTLFENVAAHKDAPVGTSDYSAATSALALLGDAYSRGLGTVYDHDRSIRLYLEAARRGNPSAQFVIAELLDLFPDALNDTDMDETTASCWYERAAAQGVNDATTATMRLLE